MNNHGKKVAIFSLLFAGLFLSCTKKEKEVSKASTTPVFTRVHSSHSGVTFRNVVDENIHNYFDNFAYVYNGGGVGIGDINNDGLADIFFTGNEVQNKLYLNEGNLKFRDITASAGVAGNGRWNNGVTLADVNSDGLLDIYVCKGGWHETEAQRKNLLFINQGDLTFREQAAEFGLDESGYSIHASFFDMDNDHDLDAYVTCRPDSFDLPLTEMVRQKILSPAISRHKLYKNDDGKFHEVGLQAGITNTFGYALSVVTADVNNDGYTDIFVANDFAESDYLYINQKNGTFREQIKEATNHISMYSMGTDIADINNDGWEDIMVSEMLPEDYQRSKVSMPSMDVQGFNAIVKSGMHKQYMHNALHLNQGNLFFSDISQLSGVAKTEWSWSCLLSDFDNDGQRDLFVANGYRRDVFDGDLKGKIAAFIDANRQKYNSPQEMLSKGFKDFINVYDPIRVTDYLFQNKGDLKFENVTSQWGFDEPGFSNGAAVGDLDNDGDLDLVINRLEDEAFLYENTSSSRNNYLKLKLDGPVGNGDGIGAKITVYTSQGIQYFENKTVRGYLSSNEPIVHFGLGQLSSVDSIHVNWNDGKTTTIPKVKSNQMLLVKYADATETKQRTTPSRPVFAKVSAPDFTAVVHRENEVNEYKDQVLLPHMFSRSGPFLAIGDVNGDGADDFFVGGATGQPGTIMVQQNGRMVPKQSAALVADKMFEDMGAALFDADADGDLDLYVVSGGSEFPEGSERYNDRLYKNDGKGNFAIAIIIHTISSGSCVVPFDADGDGDLDFFRGGHVVAGMYPKDPRSYLFINDNGVFTDKTSELAPLLARAGMVNSAVAVDLDGDEKQELVVTGEWMPIRIFQKRGSQFDDVSAGYGLMNTAGWWNRVIANDLDMDGDQDLILGNLGENYKFKTSVEKPFQVYAKDFDGNGTNDVFLARYYHDSTLVPIRGKQCSAQQMPAIDRRFPTYLSFAKADLRGILGKEMENALHYQAQLFSSVILINDGEKLVTRRLPVEAQLSTVNGIVVEDFDEDGIKDILMAGNRFDVEVETTAADASPGVFLKGYADLQFKSLKPFESGFFVPYNVKDIRAINVNNRLSILVTVNNAAMHVFQTSNTETAIALKQ
jgi:enediyne biosynthesis protein E4